ncbi:MAG TPA: nucleotidyltransferase family protein, partial [Marmoricola sp.]|nr:nucleotidyltransferase family protein [Marmoricola sp.]
MQPDPDPVDLASEVSPLLQALMGHWSQAAGVRALLIKGEIANQLRLRPTRGSIDADLWVSPDEFAQFSAFLESRGWAAPERVDSAIDLGDALVDQHSVTHRHPAWPAEVDVHRLFPGFLADPQQVFEVLWQRRQRHPIAHQEVWGPDPAGAALVQALHHLRAPDHAGHKWEFEQLVTEVSSWGQSRLSELAQLAAQVGAAESAAGFLELVGAAASGPASSSAASSEVALERW